MDKLLHYIFVYEHHLSLLLLIEYHIILQSLTYHYILQVILYEDYSIDHLKCSKSVPLG